MPAVSDARDYDRAALATALLHLRSMTQQPIVLNGRAAVRPRVSGVERWGREVIPRLRTLAPSRYLTLAPSPKIRGAAAGQAWEQLALPAAAARAGASLIFSPANLAPMIWPRNVVVLHDAAVLREAGSYSPAYRIWHGSFGLACARRAVRVVTVSEFSRRELSERTGIDDDRISVVYGGVDGRFRPDADRERAAQRLGLEKPYVLTVATDDPRKNLSALALAAQRLTGIGAELVWAGARRAHFERGDAVEGVRALGYVGEEDLPGLYAGAEAFVLPSRYEGFGLTCLEAMACGTAVVASNRGGIPEACGDAALLVDPDDPEAIADALVRSLTDDQLRARVRDAGLRRAAEITWDRTAERLNALLTAL